MHPWVSGGIIGSHQWLFLRVFLPKKPLLEPSALYAFMDMSSSTAIIEEVEVDGLDVAGSTTEAFTTIGEGVFGTCQFF